MRYRFLNPNDRNGSIPRELSSAEVAEILAEAKAAISPEQMQREEAEALRLMEHPENAISLTQVLAELEKSRGAHGG
ncbi:MAG: hypothetical protein U0793_08465 [Gemmataceae bacterium]